MSTVTNKERITWINSAVMGAVIGSILTFALPRLWDYFTRPSPKLPVTAQDLTSWFAQAENKLEASEKANKLYYGKYVTWPGTVEYVGPKKSSFMPVHLQSFVAWFDMDDEVLISFTKGKQVTITGRIYFISESIVSLDQCELVTNQ